MNLPTWEEGRPILDAYAKLTDLLEEPVYTPAIKADILELLGVLGLLRADTSTYVQLRKIRGTLLRRPPRTGPVEVVANGRSSWIGWVELNTEPVERARHRKHRPGHPRPQRGRARRGRSGEPARAQPVLRRHAEAGRRQAVRAGDARRRQRRPRHRRRPARPAQHPLVEIRTHVVDNDPDGDVFSRDCCEYHLDTRAGNRLVVLVNHFKSKGYGTKADSDERRRRQAVRVAEIYQRPPDQKAPGTSPSSATSTTTPPARPLAPLLEQTDLDRHQRPPDFDSARRRGTYRSGGEKDKIDYILLSPSLFTGDRWGVFRKGVWRGTRTKNPWDIYPTMTNPTTRPPITPPSTPTSTSEW